MEKHEKEQNLIAQSESTQLVHATANVSDLQLHSLILSAANISHTIARIGNEDWGVLVPSSIHAQALNEIAAYQEENQNWPLPPPPPDSFIPFFRAQSFLVVLSLMLFHSVTGPWSPHSLWFAKGAVNSSLIVAGGEYYRLLTALTLHSDLVHLLGNCFLGGFLLHFYFLLLGNGIGLFTLIITAVLGNYLNVLVHGPDHISVGFSTAVFSTIGILSALNYRHYKFTKPARLLLPLMAGAAMLAMLGSNGERTDLGAHFFGLMTGLVAGTFLGINSIFKLRNNRSLQLILASISLLSPVFAWQLALF